jgi:hypothetical protein
MSNKALVGDISSFIQQRREELWYKSCKSLPTSIVTRPNLIDFRMAFNTILMVSLYFLTLTRQGRMIGRLTETPPVGIMGLHLTSQSAEQMNNVWGKILEGKPTRTVGRAKSGVVEESYLYSWPTCAQTILVTINQTRTPGPLAVRVSVPTPDHPLLRYRDPDCLVWHKPLGTPFKVIYNPPSKL